MGNARLSILFLSVASEARSLVISVQATSLKPRFSGREKCGLWQIDFCQDSTAANRIDHATADLSQHPPNNYGPRIIPLSSFASVCIDVCIWKPRKHIRRQMRSFHSTTIRLMAYAGFFRLEQIPSTKTILPGRAIAIVNLLLCVVRITFGQRMASGPEVPLVDEKLIVHQLISLLTKDSTFTPAG